MVNMSTLPANFRVKEESCDTNDPSTTRIAPKPLGSYQYHAYICQESRDSGWTDMNLIQWLEERRGYVCAEYHRDVLIGEKVLDVMCNFIFTSDKMIIILSERFVNSPLMMCQLHLAVRYSIDHACMKIITLQIDDCKLPALLCQFEYVKFDPKQDWKRKITAFLDKPNLSMPEDFCTDDSHISSSELFKTARSVMSEPATLNSSKNALRIPENIRTKIKIWYRSKSIEEALLLPGKDKSKETSAQTDQGDTPKKKKAQSEQEVALAHALNIRSKGKQVFEATKSNLTRHEGELAVVEGDVLELLQDQPVHGHLYKCANSRGVEGLVSKNFLVPSVHFLPSSVVQMTRSAKSSKQNAEFKGKLVEFGCACYQVVKGAIHNNFQQLSLQKDDILFQLTKEAGGRAKFKNCLNETGYVLMDNVVRVPDQCPSPDRSSLVSNISTGSEGYGSETGEQFSSQADC